MQLKAGRRRFGSGRVLLVDTVVRAIQTLADLVMYHA